MTTETKYAPGTHPDLPPPPSTVGVVGWLRKNLFSNTTNTLLTVLSLYMLYILVPPVISWVFINSDLNGDSRDACTSGGACWVFIKARLGQFVYGFYPTEERWRIDSTFYLLIALMTPMFIEKFRYKAWLGAFVLFVYPVVGFYLLAGGSFGLAEVETSMWGGLSLTLIISIVGIVGSFPIGLVLALGRRSKMPAVSAFCTGFIELWRGVPLITVLFMSSVMFPLFLPEGVNFDKLIRALVGVTLFTAAYMAETVRGGLQAIPKGQYEGAEALGLSYWKSMSFIILPQALKHVIPGIVGNCIGLFKDTTLVLIIGLFDFLGIVQAAATDPKWLGYSVEGYVFCAFVYWVFCFSMSKYSQSVERKLDTGHAKR
ncbi:MAG: amino acid ABC transporter permease [Gammaproteobacteria bacterium]|nr:amino acid ABC transporter permease [Gammaproteobacteria bacterium]